MVKFKKGDKVRILSKSYGRDLKKIDYNNGIITNVIYHSNDGKIYMVNMDYFLESDLELYGMFSDEEFMI